LDHFSRFYVVTVDGDRLRYNPALVIGGAFDLDLESGYQHDITQLRLFPTKKTSLILRLCGVVEHHSGLPVLAVHNQRFAGTCSDHSLYLSLVASLTKGR
jgi:hypothetical protein